MSRNGQTIKGVKHFARYYRDNMEYKTNYRRPLEGWTVIDEMNKSDDLIEILEKHVVHKIVFKAGGFNGYVLTTYHLPILGIREERTTEFQIRTPHNASYYRTHKRKECGVCGFDFRDNVNRTSRRNEMSNLKKKIDMTIDKSNFDEYTKFDFQNRWDQ